jgi:hypothetical protein
MDRGFFSTSNILNLVNSPVQISFLQPLSLSLKKTKELISKHSKALKNNNTAFKYNEEIIHYIATPFDIENHHFTAHIFFNEKAELEQRHHFLSDLLDIESHIKTINLNQKKKHKHLLTRKYRRNGGYFSDGISLQTLL